MLLRFKTNKRFATFVLVLCLGKFFGFNLRMYKLGKSLTVAVAVIYMRVEMGDTV